MENKIKFVPLALSLGLLVLEMYLLLRSSDYSVLWFVLIFLFIYLAIREIELLQIRNARPRLKAEHARIQEWVTKSAKTGRGWTTLGTNASIETEINNPLNFGEQRTEDFLYALAGFVNNPERRSGIPEAKNVWARIKYYDDESGDDLLPDTSVDGLWIDYFNPEIYRLKMETKHKRELTQINIEPTGRPVTLCLAAKLKEDSSWYAYTYESYNNLGLRSREYFLGSRNIRIHVTLTGNDVTFDRWYRITNKSGQSEIEEIER